MKVAGIIAEYNPLHSGHLLHLAQTRTILGPDTPIVCVMSGNYVQRGDFAIVRKCARAEAAVKSGVDLVLELPLPWSVSSAENFAAGGVQTLAATGLVTHLSFGSECGDAGALMRVAAALEAPAFSQCLRRELTRGVSFAAARQRAAESLLDAADVALLERPNDILGIEYAKALLRQKAAMQPLAVLRQGAAHDGDRRNGISSASGIRALLRTNPPAALEQMAPTMAEIFRREMEDGRAPVFAENCQRAILAKLRSLSREECLALDGGREGLGNRFYRAAQQEISLEALLSATKTKRYAHARLRRMALWAWLGLREEKLPREVPYLRVLAANAVGCKLLFEMKKSAAVPVLTKAADVRVLSAPAQELLYAQARATDLYVLAYPNLAAAVGGAEWREGPVILPK